MDEHEEWLKGLKVGDVVALSGRRGEYGGMKKITRETALYWIVGKPNFVGEVHEYKYRKSDGYAPGGSVWGTDSIENPTSESVLAAREKVLRSRALDKIRAPEALKGLTSVQIESVLDFIAKLREGVG